MPLVSKIIAFRRVLIQIVLWQSPFNLCNICWTVFVTSVSRFPSFSLCVLSEFAVPPDILDYPTSTDMVVREGTNVTLRCAATGSPQPTVTWRREGGESIPLGSGQEGNECECIQIILLCQK